MLLLVVPRQRTAKVQLPAIAVRKGVDNIKGGDITRGRRRKARIEDLARLIVQTAGIAACQGVVAAEDAGEVGVVYDVELEGRERHQRYNTEMEMHTRYLTLSTLPLPVETVRRSKPAGATR